MASTRIIELASIISTNTRKIDTHLSQKGLPTPSFEANCHPQLLFGHGEDIETARQAVVDATDELQALMLGPGNYISSLFHNTLLSTQALLQFNLLSFPSNHKETTFAELAMQSNLPEHLVKRLLRHAMAFRILSEPRPGIVTHTSISACLATPPMRAWTSFVTEELWPSAARTVEALQKWPDAQEPARTGFSLAHGTEDIFFEVMKKETRRGQRYAQMLDCFRTQPAFSVQSLVDAVPWGTHGLVVDVGGSTGLTAQAIVAKHANVKVVVQDHAAPVEEGRKTLPAEFEGRIEFVEHDFFEEQPVQGADVYLLRWILHDWSDRYALKVLRALVPALKKGARVVLNETVVPPAEVVGCHTNQFLRMMDLSMLELHNGKERDAEDWERLFKECDERFKFVSARPLMGAALGLVEAVWEP